MKANRFVALLVVALFSCAVAHAVPITIPTVPVGNPGNPGQVQPQGTFGSVDYNFRIGKYEVTNAQYTSFLNAVAATDPFALYNANMESSPYGGITQSGSSGSFTYATKPGRENRPVNFVSWYDAIRFANWLHNGQGSGDTEDGAYTLLGGTPTPSNGLSITRNPSARWWLPSEDEWYKAAYHKNDGITGNYWLFPTGADSTPIPEPPHGGPNSANFANVVGTVTNVGAYVDSPSPYGTFDQGGNVWEWNETLIGSSSRGMRGSSWNNFPDPLRASFRAFSGPAAENFALGFRVASIPEPATPCLGVLGGITMLLWRRGRR